MEKVRRPQRIVVADVKDANEDLLPMAAGGCDRGLAVLQLHVKTLEVEAIKRHVTERRQVLKNLKQREEELHKNHRTAMVLQKNFFHKDEEYKNNLSKAEKEMEKVRQLEAEIQKLKKESAALTEIKQELERKVQKHSVYMDYLQRVCRITKFEDPDALADHLEGLLDLKQQLCQRENEAQEKVDLQKKSMAALEDQHNLLVLQKHHELSKLRSEFQKAHSEAVTWEKKWKHIQETAAKKTLTLGQIKVAILNLYEMTGAAVGREGVEMNDTEKQLEQIKTFFADNRDIVRQHSEQTEGNEKKCDKAKKFISKKK